MAIANTLPRYHTHEKFYIENKLCYRSKISGIVQYEPPELAIEPNSQADDFDALVLVEPVNADQVNMEECSEEELLSKILKQEIAFATR